MSTPNYGDFYETHVERCEKCQERLDLLSDQDQFVVEKCLDLQNELKANPRPEDVYGGKELL